MSTRLRYAARIALAVCALGCAPPAPPGPDGAGAGRDQPPAELRSESLVRCLIDAPDGCTGCDRGDTCVYREMKEYDCVYIVYGTKCAP
jgi:hypothetical protein